MKRLCIAAAVSVLALAGCSSQAAPSSSPTPATSSASPSPSTSSSFSFGQTLPPVGFVSVTTGQPTPFKPAYTGGKGRTFYVQFTVKNDSLNTYKTNGDFYDSTSANGVECSVEIDEDQGVKGTSTVPIPKGKSATWKSGYSCDAPKGAELVMSVNVISGKDPFVVTGTLP